MTQPFQRIGLGDAEKLFQDANPTILDARDARAYMAGHIDGARHLSGANLSAFVAQVAKDRPMLIYCYHGVSSQDYARVFAEAGFAETYSLDGGYEAWRNRNIAPSATPIEPALAEWLVAQGFPADDIDATIANKMTPLMQASHKGETEMARLLIAAGAQLEKRNGDGSTAIWLACVGQHVEIIDLLIDAGINLDNQNDNGATSLMYAASSGRTAVVAKLLAKGADASAETLDGFSALDMAANLECLNLLRQHRQRAAQA
jgi:rhodanese-related sulfurtransferase